jgi:hypothetical protein
MSMFQILTQEGWVEVVSGTLSHTPSDFFIVLIRLYFLFYHQFVSVVSKKYATKYSLHISMLTCHIFKVIPETEPVSFTKSGVAYLCIL